MAPRTGVEMHPLRQKTGAGQISRATRLRPTRIPLAVASVAFGRGLNTAQVGNKVNDAMLPNNIKINLDGVVHFLVAGFHQPVVYKPGTKPEDIIVPATGTFINDATNRFYLGINPAGGPLNTPATPIVPGDTRSNAQNRVESVGFPASVGTGTPPSEKASQGSIW